MEVRGEARSRSRECFTSCCFGAGAFVSSIACALTKRFGVFGQPSAQGRCECGAWPAEQEAGDGFAAEGIFEGKIFEEKFEG